MTKTENDNLGKVGHFERIGPICTTEFVKGKGYYWRYLDAERMHGPYSTREQAYKASLKN